MISGVFATNVYNYGVSVAPAFIFVELLGAGVTGAGAGFAFVESPIFIGATSMILLATGSKSIALFA